MNESERSGEWPVTAQGGGPKRKPVVKFVSIGVVLLALAVFTLAFRTSQWATCALAVMGGAWGLVAFLFSTRE